MCGFRCRPLSMVPLKQNINIIWVVSSPIGLSDKGRPSYFGERVCKICSLEYIFFQFLVSKVWFYKIEIKILSSNIQIYKQTKQFWLNSQLVKLIQNLGPEQARTKTNTERSVNPVLIGCNSDVFWISKNFKLHVGMVFNGNSYKVFKFFLECSIFQDLQVYKSSEYYTH